MRTGTSMIAPAIAMLVAAITLGPIAASARQLTPGTVLRDCSMCPELVVIAAGSFVMGRNATLTRSKPPHAVTIPRAFALGRYEVTFDEWQACLDAGGCTHDPHDHNWGRGRRPVINVTIKDVEDYLRWLGAKAGHTYRLPSEAEWEYADRAGSATTFWWGDNVGKNRANCKDCYSKWSAKSTGPVGSFPPNPFGLHDTTGNVFEWVRDCWNGSHVGAPADGSARTDGDCRRRVIRGGSFYYFQKVSRSSHRTRNPTGVKSYWLGFRVARDLP